MCGYVGCACRSQKRVLVGSLGQGANTHLRDMDAGLLASILMIEHRCCSLLSHCYSSVTRIFKWITSTFPFSTQSLVVLLLLGPFFRRENFGASRSEAARPAVVGPSGLSSRVPLSVLPPSSHCSVSSVSSGSWCSLPVCPDSFQYPSSSSFSELCYVIKPSMHSCVYS